ncbi:MAG: cytochrome family [Thermoleophilaceae bacterium]|nr:cytochrome family [Thermoleophilaceae bacterium]
MEASTSVPNFPPGPRAPRIFQTLGFVLRPARYLDGCRRRYGNVVSFSTLFDSRFVIVFDPASIKQVFQGSPEQLRAGEANSLLGPVLGERSVLLLDGHEHLRQRRLMLPAFHGQRMRAYETIMREAADREIDSWPVGEEFELLPAMQAVTLDVIMRAVFGVEEGKRLDDLRHALRAMIQPISRPLGILVLTLSFARRQRRPSGQEDFEARRRRVDELIYDEIARRRQASDLEEREDVFSMLLLARDEDGQPMTDEEVRDELVTLLVAGHETTAPALAWAFDLLLHDPRVMAKVREAIAEGDDDYLDAVVKETLRIRPVIPGIGRVVRGEPYEVGGYSIPPGVEINPSIAGVHRGADFPAAREFRPERFLEDDPPDTYTWIPFGGGVRRCIGASFALFEMRVVVRQVLERAALEPVQAEGDEIQRRGITMAPKHGAPVRLTRAPRPADASLTDGAMESAAGSSALGAEDTGAATARP